MVRTHLLQMAVVLSLSLPLTNQAFAENVVCPSSIAVKESLEHQAPEGWATQYDNSIRYLVGVTFFDGDPKENKSIAPIRDSPLSEKDRISLWRFGSSGVPVWLGCKYLDTGVSLTRQLSISYEECRVSYGPGGIIKAINCK
jgi:hypothetical protein